MAITTSCPGCYVKLKVDDKCAGKTVRCPKCNGVVNVPESVMLEPVFLAAPPSPPAMIAQAIGYNHADGTFTGSQLDIVKLAIKAILQLGFRVSVANEALGLVSFEVGAAFFRFGGQYSLYVEAAQESFRIRVDGFETSSNPNAALGLALRNSAGGATDAIAQKVREAMRELIAPTPNTSASASPSVPRSTNPPSTSGGVSAMMLGGGIWACILGVIHLIAAAGLCVTVFTGLYSIVVGVLAIIASINMSDRNLGLPKAVAIMQIVNIISCDAPNLVLGIIELVKMNDTAKR